TDQLGVGMSALERRPELDQVQLQKVVDTFLVQVLFEHSIPERKRLEAPALEKLVRLSGDRVVLDVEHALAQKPVSRLLHVARMSAPDVSMDIAPLMVEDHRNRVTGFAS